MIEERTLICNACSFYKDACTAGCCPHMGKIEDEFSRCPQNKWPDGWGNTPLIPTNEESTTQEIVIYNENAKSIITEEEIIEKSNPLYAFASEEEGKQFYDLKSKFNLSI